jgi:hypothetical protein
LLIGDRPLAKRLLAFGERGGPLSEFPAPRLEIRGGKLGLLGELMCLVGLLLVCRGSGTGGSGKGRQKGVWAAPATLEAFSCRHD